MARTGRPPKSVEQKRHDGTLLARDKQTPFLIGGRSKPTPSMLLSEGQVGRFTAIVAELESSGILDAADRGMIELAAIEEANVILCNAVLAAPDNATKALGTNGIIIMGAMGGPILNPAINARAKSLTHLRQLYAELGIGPASRARFQNLGVKGREAAKDIEGLGDEPELKVLHGGRTT